MSLAQSLKQRRDFQDVMDQERQAHGLMNKSFQGKYAVLKQIDEAGSTIRIRAEKKSRPETPKVNLLELQRRRTEAMNMVKIEKKVFNYNPYTNLALLQQRSTEEQTQTQVLASQNLKEEAVKIEDKVVVMQQDQLMSLIEQEEVEDVIDLNEKFLSMALNIDVAELQTLTKIELRVDTSCHNLQVTGEILPLLDLLKLNDSVIKCFRDIGTSFKNVRVLHIARCEIREVQGIQAFLQLEELYCSFNDIDDIFDISFLEHLKILDFEGNNVTNIQQLFYLKRLQNLTDVNFKQNPVAKNNPKEYYQALQESCLQLDTLDDEPVTLFKAQPIKIQLPTIAESDFVKRFVKLGLNSTEIIQLCNKAQESMMNEPDDETLLVQTIKSQNRDLKAKQSYEQNIKFFQQEEYLSGENDDDFRRTSSLNFYKQSIKEQGRLTHNNFFDDDSSTSELITNTSQVIAGGSFSILRQKNVKLNTGMTQALSNDIRSLIREFHNDTDTFKEVSYVVQIYQNVRDKLNESSLKIRKITGTPTKLIRTSSAKKRINVQQAKKEPDIVPQTNEDMKEALSTMLSSIKTNAANIKIKHKESATTLIPKGENPGKIVLKGSRILFNKSETK